MAHQIIKQPNGNYSIYSSIIEDIIGYDLTKEELISFYKEEAAKKAEIETKILLNRIDSGQKPYGQFTITWEKVKNLINTK